MATLVRHAIRTVAGWASDQTNMEATYGEDGYYTTPQLWEDDVPYDLVTPDLRHQGELFKDWSGGFVGRLEISAKNSSSFCRVVFRNANFEGTYGDSKHQGVVGGGAYMTNSATWDATIENNATYTELAYLDVRNTSTAETGRATSITGGVYYCQVRSCIFPKGIESLIFPNRDVTIKYNLVKDSTYGLYTANYAHDTCLIYGNTLINSRIRSTSTGNGPSVRNNVIYGGTTPLFNLGSYSAFTNNASSDTSGQITNIASSEFYDYAGGDYHLAHQSTLRGAGINLQQNSYLSGNQYDVDGNQFPTTGAIDIGADSYAVATATIDSERTIPSVGYVTNYSEGIIPSSGYTTKLVAKQPIIPLVMHYLQQMRN